MHCSNCGSPYDVDEVRAGTCSSCGAVLAHVVKAAEQAALVDEVLAKGGSVRVGELRIEAAAPAPPVPPRGVAPLVVLGVVMGLCGVGGVFAFFAMAPSSRPAPTTPATTPEPPAFSVAVPAPSAVAPLPSGPVASSAGRRESPARPAASVAASGNARVIGVAQPRFERCYRAEVARDANAPRRYTLALAIDDAGGVTSAEVLSLASAEMKACLTGVARALVFPPGTATRETATLRFGAER